MSNSPSYPLGYSDREAQRLKDQAAQVEQLTEELLRRAGLREGMRVLDIGSGMGEVSLLAARLVGADGAVLGVERAASSVEMAQRRADDLGLHNVRFVQGELAAFETDAKFDALIGRFVLSYVPGRAAILRRLSQHLNPGAIIAFQELDMLQIAQAPPSDLFVQARRWVLEGFAATGAELEMGTKLYSTFLQAGLPAPDMFAMQPVVGESASQGYSELAQALRSLMPVIERGGIANSAEIDVDTLAERLRTEAIAHQRVLFMSRIIGAWTQLAA